MPKHWYKQCIDRTMQCMFHFTFASFDSFYILFRSWSRTVFDGSGFGSEQNAYGSSSGSASLGWDPYRKTETDIPHLPSATCWLVPASRHTCLLHRALGADNLCRISSGNVLAFSSSGGPEEGLNVSARGYHVFVADLNTPWDIHLLVLNRAAAHLSRYSGAFDS